MKGIEDMLEQNDNSLDGVLNNIDLVLPVVLTIPAKEDKESVKKRMQLMLELMVRRHRMENGREQERGMTRDAEERYSNEIPRNGEGE